MMLNRSATRIVISDAPHGYDVAISPNDFDQSHERDMWIEDREFAQAYARGLSWGTGWPIDDQSTGGSTSYFDLRRNTRTAEIDFHLAPLRAVPPHLVALQTLVDRCETAADKKELIVVAGSLEVISRDEGCIMVTANMVETA